MNIFESVLLGIIQGITEFLPVSSSGHLEIFKSILNFEPENGLIFNLILHLGTIFSILFVFRKDIFEMVLTSVKPSGVEEKRFILFLIVSALPIGVLELFFGEQVEKLFESNLRLVGICLIVTSILLFVSNKLGKANNKVVNLPVAISMGLAQLFAVLPGLSRSGATISTALLLGIRKDLATKFSFLMLIIPVVGASFIWILDIIKNKETIKNLDILLAGFVASFVVGIFAAKLMISIVKKSKLNIFACYCLLMGILTLGYSILN
jgi:undecaprenyl-diphosphatase